MQKGVEIRVRANTTQAKKEIKSLEQSVASLETTANKVATAFKAFAVTIAGIGVTKALTSASDALTEMNNRLALVVGRGKELGAVMNEMYSTAQRTRQPVKTVTDTFSRLGLALKDSGASADELLIATEAIQQAAQISGASAETASQSIIQLGQGLASGQLRGEELNSVLEGIPRLARAIAKGMGIPFEDLRDLAKDGKLEAESVFRAIIDQAEALDTEFQTLEATTVSLKIVLADQFKKSLGLLDQEIGFGKRMRETLTQAILALNYFNDNIALWVSGIKLKIALAYLDFVDFKIRIKEIFQDIFKADGFDAGAFVDAFTAPFGRAKTAAIGLWESIAPDLPTIDLASKIPTFDSIKGNLEALKDGVIGVFHEIWKRIVGNSLWTGIFDENHKEQGQTLAINSSLTDYFASPLAQLSEFGKKIIDVFNNINVSVSAAWQNIWDKLVNKTIDTPAGPQVVETPFGAGIRKLKEEAASAKRDLDSVYDKLTTKEVMTDFGPDRVETQFGAALKSLREEAKGLKNDLTSIWSNAFDVERIQGSAGPAFTAETSRAENLASRVQALVSANYDGIMMSLTAAMNALASSPLVVAGKVTFDFLGNQFTSLVEGLSSIDPKQMSVDIYDWLYRNKDKIGAGVSLGFAAVWRFGIRNSLLGAGVGAAFGLGLGQELAGPEFQKALESQFKGITEIIVGAIKSDPGAEGVNLIATSLSSIGEGILEGIFGGDFQGSMSAKIAGAITGITALAVLSTTARAALFKLGAAIVGQIFASAVITEFIAGATIGLTNGMAGLAASQGLRNAAGDLGITLGTLIQAGILLGIAGLGAKLLTEATDYVTNKAQRGSEQLLTGKTQSQISSDRAQGALSAAREGKIEAVMLQWERGQITQADLANLTAEELQELKDAVSESKGAYQGVIGTLDNLQRSITGLDIITDVEVKFTQMLESVKILDSGLVRLGEKLGASSVTTSTASGFSTGGAISGPGGPTDDKIPAMLSNGEYVIKASTVSKFGMGFMNKLNQGILPQYFAEGGSPDVSTYPYAADILELEQKKFGYIAMGETDAVSYIDRQLADAYARRRAWFAGQGNVDLSGPLSEGEAALGKSDKDDKANKSAQSFLDNFKGSFATSLSTLLKTGDFKGFMNSILDSFTSNIIDSFVEGFTNSLFGEGGFLKDLFKNMTSWGGSIAKSSTEGIKSGAAKTFSGKEGGGGLSGLGGFFKNIFGGLLGTGGGGGLFSSIFGVSFGSVLGFSSGGIVPMTPYAQAGKDSVPAMLTPGEMVVPTNKVNSFMNGNTATQQQVFNLNITGDVSRQTRAEIAKMIPQITTGVNAHNYENNYRR